MNLQNTYGSEDQAIERAKSAVDDLLDIIKRLDDLIEDWKEVSGCDSPDELREKMEDERLEAKEREDRE